MSSSAEWHPSPVYDPNDKLKKIKAEFQRIVFAVLIFLILSRGLSGIVSKSARMTPKMNIG